MRRGATTERNTDGRHARLLLGIAVVALGFTAAVGRVAAAAPESDVKRAAEQHTHNVDKAADFVQRTLPADDAKDDAKQAGNDAVKQALEKPAAEVVKMAAHDVGKSADDAGQAPGADLFKKVPGPGDLKDKDEKGSAASLLKDAGRQLGGLTHDALKPTPKS